MKLFFYTGFLAITTFNGCGQIKNDSQINWNKVSAHDTIIYKNYNMGIAVFTQYDDLKDSSIQSGYISLISKKKSKWYICSVIPFSFNEFHKYSDFKIFPEFQDINSDNLPELFLFKGYGGKGGGTDDQRYFNVYLIDKDKKQLKQIVYKDEIVNPVYDKETKLLQLNYSKTIIYTKLVGNHLIFVKEDKE